jgi:type II secretory pathway pseudopilin PulG
VCIAVIGVLLSLVLPAVQNARASARSADCKNRLRQIGLASHNFHAAHRAFPQEHHYYESLMPYLDLQNLPDRIEAYRANPNGINPRDNLGTPPVFVCPSGDVNPAELEVSYLRSMGTRLDPFNQNVVSNGTLFTDFQRQKPISFSHVTDGASNTAFWSETLSWQRSYRKADQENEPGLYWRQIAQQPNSMRELQQLCRTADGRHRRQGLLRHSLLIGTISISLLPIQFLVLGTTQYPRASPANRHQARMLAGSMFCWSMVACDSYPIPLTKPLGVSWAHETATTTSIVFNPQPECQRKKRCHRKKRRKDTRYAYHVSGLVCWHITAAYWIAHRHTFPEAEVNSSLDTKGEKPKSKTELCGHFDHRIGTP